MQTDFDLLSLVLTLTPVEGPPKRELPAWWGRAAHAWLLEVVESGAGTLPPAWHETETGPRPFTASTLMGYSARRGVEAGRTYSLRLTAYHRQAAEPLLAATEPGGKLAPDAVVELDGLPFRVGTVDTGGDAAAPWAGRGTYAGVSAPFLLASRALPRQVRMQFSSPTTFKSGGMNVPIPLPGLVFGSLLDRWNAYAHIAFPAEVKRYAEECLAMSRLELASRGVPGKGGSMRVGSVGEMQYTTLNEDRYWMSVIHTLAAFARYAGVGAGTSYGMGQCRTLIIE
ncbi:MAG: CRISPR system precrRNA processing endoribonuclease RAMP protein Cas6 [Anaerolineales bacterium]|nr:CRISPR system precrRNA processing endoribonuclease RAMP protein Cas6 [Anaerolineales bacterium]